MPGLKLRAPDGRRWTLKDIVQGKPLGHPSHAMFVHFPVAFYIGTLAFDIMSRVGQFPEAPLTATWLILAGFAGSIFAVITGLVDWFGMVPGSTKKRWATRHMLFQFTTGLLFMINLRMRWPDRYSPESETSWIVVGAIGFVVLSIGQWMGGVLVYEMGMRVKTGAAE